MHEWDRKTSSSDVLQEQLKCRYLFQKSVPGNTVDRGLYQWKSKKKGESQQEIMGKREKRRHTAISSSWKEDSGTQSDQNG